jgi:alkylation response protein AidB-like acyl-CoA dehydrogenase
MTRDLVARFVDVFDAVGAEAITRERERRLPYAEVELLREAGFTRVTLPVEHGGEGADHIEFFELLAELARRDSNIAQLFRSHFSFIDRTLHAPASAERDARLARLAGGAIVGNASHEKSTAKVGSFDTRVEPDGDGLRLDGTKYYSTGTLFADIVSVAAIHEERHVGVLVSTKAPGVERVDDWTGFGQRMTGSGTTIFTSVEVGEHDIVHFDREKSSHGGAFVQLVLLAAVTGIGRAIVDDATTYLRKRTRTYSHGSAATAQQDPLVQEAVGDLSAYSFSADSALAAAVRSLARSSEAILAGADDESQKRRVAEVEFATAQAQLVILPAVLNAATALFDVGGASAVDTSLALDRHWRNARTIASHNPAKYRARAIGDQLINDTPIVAWWSTGEA